MNLIKIINVRMKNFTESFEIRLYRLQASEQLTIRHYPLNRKIRLNNKNE